MKRYADAVAPPNEGSERVKTRGRKRSGSLPFFWAGWHYADDRTAERRGLL